MVRVTPAKNRTCVWMDEWTCGYTIETRGHIGLDDSMEWGGMDGRDAREREREREREGEGVRG